MTSVSRTLGRCLRETGQALHRFGHQCQDSTLVMETFSRHRQLMPLAASAPAVAKDAWVAPSATLVGEVDVSGGASVWYGAVVRGDAGAVAIGEDSNVQDDAILGSGDVSVGAGVTIGHGAIIKSSTVADGSMVGMKAIVESATVEQGSIVAAGAVVKPDTVVGAGQVWGGNPAVYMRNVTPAEKAQLTKSAEGYVALAGSHATSIAA
ncbi:unnamed protein product [Ectocarpus fasciculatus]